MTGKQPGDVSTSVKARLMNHAKKNGEAFDLVLVRFALERLLYRLSKSRHRDRFVVKGAMMFQVRSNLPHRSTRDLDLLAVGEPSIESFVETFRELCAQLVEDDGLVFVADSVSATKMKEDEEYEGLRMKFDAKVGSAPRGNFRFVKAGSLAAMGQRRWSSANAKKHFHKNKVLESRRKSQQQ